MQYQTPIKHTHKVPEESAPATKGQVKERAPFFSDLPCSMTVELQPQRQSKGRCGLEVAETYKCDREQQSLTRGTATVLLAGFMPVFLQGAALCHVNMPAGYPWHGAAPSNTNKCKFHLEAAGCSVVGFFSKFCCMLSTL